MNRITFFVRKKWPITQLLAAMAAGVLLCANVPAQAPQQGGSLADAARQARAQKQAQPLPTGDNHRAQQVANELSEDQNDTGAPGGFKTYNAGDYTLWVPAPYHLDGHDSAGVVLSGPQMGLKHPIVLVGTPIVAHFQDDNAFQDSATQFSHLYAESANCQKTTVAGHGAYECSLAAANLLGQRVSGNAVFVHEGGNIYPVFCVTPSESRSRDFINNTHWANSMKDGARETLAQEEDDARKVYRNCDTVFQSIHITGTAQKGTVADSKSAQQATGAVTPANNGSLADIARGAHDGHPQPAVVAAQPLSPPQSTVPAGYKVQAFNYCQSATQCWDASVLVPAEAQLVSSDCKQFVFEMKVQGSPFVLLAGLAGAGSCAGRNANDANQVRWNQMVDPETKRAPGTAATITSQTTKIDGKFAAITTMSFKKGLADWMSKRAEVDSNGSQIVVGCMAPREHFGDGDAVCTALIGSLRLP